MSGLEKGARLITWDFLSRGNQRVRYPKDGVSEERKKASSDCIAKLAAKRAARVKELREGV